MLYYLNRPVPYQHQLMDHHHLFGLYEVTIVDIAVSVCYIVTTSVTTSSTYTLKLIPSPRSRTIPSQVAILIVLNPIALGLATVHLLMHHKVTTSTDNFNFSINFNREVDVSVKGSLLPSSKISSRPRSTLTLIF